MNVSCSNCHYDDCQDTDRYCIKCGHRMVRLGFSEEDCTATKRVYDSTMVHVRLGIVYMQNGKRDRAIASWKAALDIDSGNEDAQALLRKYGEEEETTGAKKARAAEAA